MNCVTHVVDLVMEEGCTFDKWFRWKVGTSYVPIDDYTAVMHCRKKIKDAVPLLTLPTIAVPWAADGDSGIYILDDGVDADLVGKYQIYVNNEDLTGICLDHKDIDEGIYMLTLQTAAGEVVLKQHGSLIIHAAGLWS